MKKERDRIVYPAKKGGEEFYWDRVDRAIGWLVRKEQEFLRQATVAVAGVGGAGGLMSTGWTRAGIGRIRIAEFERFDPSNINRQIGATRLTLGKNKARVTAKLHRSIANDGRLDCFPSGINEATVEHFVRGADLIYDEVEVHSPARILLHQCARAYGVPVINCNVVGGGSFLFFYTKASKTMEWQLGLTYHEAVKLETAMRAGDTAARAKLVRHLIGGLVPKLPSYRKGDTRDFMQRLLGEGKASILAWTPMLAAGIMSLIGARFLLEQAGTTKHNFSPREIPLLPGYLHFDAWTWKATVGRKPWAPWQK